MLKKKHLIIFFFSLLFNSCEKAIEMDSFDFNNKLVCNCLIDNDKCNLILNNNKSNQSEDGFNFITGANCMLSEHKLIEKDRFYSLDFTKFSTTDTIKLHISKTGYSSVNSLLVVPSTPEFEIIDTAWITDKNYFWGNKHLQINIRLNDKIHSQNDYYFIELNAIWYSNESYYDNNIDKWVDKLRRYKEIQTFYIKDNAAEIVSNGGIDFRLNKTEFTLNDDMVFPEAIIMSDKTFNGNAKIIALHCQPASLIDKIAEIKVSSINIGFYDFIKSVAAYNFNNPIFNDPVRIKSNINNGLGYFGVKVTVTDSIIINNKQ